MPIKRKQTYTPDQMEGVCSHLRSRIADLRGDVFVRDEKIATLKRKVTIQLVVTILLAIALLLVSLSK